MSIVLRVNARLSRERAEKIARVKKATGKSTSEILGDAIDNLAEPAPQKNGLEKWGDFVGCFKGGGSLSKNYKGEVARIIDEKYPRHR